MQIIINLKKRKKKSRIINVVMFKKHIFEHKNFYGYFQTIKNQKQIFLFQKQERERKRNNRKGVGNKWMIISVENEEREKGIFLKEMEVKSLKLKFRISQFSFLFYFILENKTFIFFLSCYRYDLNIIQYFIIYLFNCASCVCLYI